MYGDKLIATTLSSNWYHRIYENVCSYSFRIMSFGKDFSEFKLEKYKNLYYILQFNNLKIF